MTLFFLFTSKLVFALRLKHTQYGVKSKDAQESIKNFYLVGMSIYQQHLENYKATKFANRGQLDTIMAVKHHIDQHYQEELNLDVLSTEGFVSKYHMLRLFKKYHGQTPSQYLTDKRLEKAKELLKSGASVTETCYAVGFKSLGSFSTLFKRRNSISPKEFQKRAILKK